jgi:ABC-type bacteriocin/lantibiotic exporter with double-glycine peptidase domain
MKIGIENQRVNNSINHNYIDYLRDQCNSIVASELTSQLEQNYSNYQCIYLSQSKFNGAFNFAEGMAQKLIYLVLVMFGSYLIIEQKNLDLGQLIFLINLMVMMSGALNGICGFVVKKIEYVQMSEIYKNFISLENHENKCTTTISSVRTIKIDGKKIKSGQILERTNELVDALLLGQSDIKLQINDVNIDMLSKQNYFSKLFIINYNTKLSKD